MSLYGLDWANLRVPLNAGNFLTSCKPVSFSRRTLHNGVSKYVKPSLYELSLHTVIRAGKKLFKEIICRCNFSKYSTVRYSLFKNSRTYKQTFDKDPFSSHECMKFLWLGEGFLYFLKDIQGAKC